MLGFVVVPTLGFQTALFRVYGCSVSRCRCGAYTLLEHYAGSLSDMPFHVILYPNPIGNV